VRLNVRTEALPVAVVSIGVLLNEASIGSHLVSEGRWEHNRDSVLPGNQFPVKVKKGLGL
jgi:hypothetical protein